VRLSVLRMIWRSRVLPVIPPTLLQVVWSDVGPGHSGVDDPNGGGSNYFIKLEDMHERPARAYFLHGGLTQTFPVPLGTFALKYATGSSWCGEGEFFGDETVYHKADRTLLFDQTVHADADGTTTLTSDVTVELIRQRNGNLPTHTISRKEF
jgi:hypothetical protein